MDAGLLVHDARSFLSLRFRNLYSPYIHPAESTRNKEQNRAIQVCLLINQVYRWWGLGSAAELLSQGFDHKRSHREFALPGCVCYSRDNTIPLIFLGIRERRDILPCLLDTVTPAYTAEFLRWHCMVM